MLTQERRTADTVGKTTAVDAVICLSGVDDVVTGTSVNTLQLEFDAHRVLDGTEIRDGNAFLAREVCPWVEEQGRIEHSWICYRLSEP